MTNKERRFEILNEMCILDRRMFIQDKYLKSLDILFNVWKENYENDFPNIKIQLEYLRFLINNRNLLYTLDYENNELEKFISNICKHIMCQVNVINITNNDKYRKLHDDSYEIVIKFFYAFKKLENVEVEFCESIMDELNISTEDLVQFIKKETVLYDFLYTKS